MKRTLAALLAAALVEPALLACPVCFQADDSATSRGIQAAVVVLFAVTTGVLSVCGVFVARFASRERELFRGANPPAARDPSADPSSVHPTYESQFRNNSTARRSELRT
jgi:hypothetical protein